MKIAVSRSPMLALFLALALAAPSPALALRVSQEGAGLEELRRQLAPAAGMEEESQSKGPDFWERHVRETRDAVGQQVKQKLSGWWIRWFPSGGVIPVDFDQGVYGILSDGKLHPHWALVKGRGGDWWLHLHLKESKTKSWSTEPENGLLFQLVFSKKKELVGLGGVLAEPNGSNWGKVLFGFVPLEDLVPQKQLGWLREAAWKLVQRHARILKSHIKRNRPKFVLGLAAMSIDRKAFLYQMLSVKKLGEHPRFERDGVMYVRLDTQAGLEELLDNVEGTPFDTVTEETEREFSSSWLNQLP